MIAFSGARDEPGAACAVSGEREGEGGICCWFMVSLTGVLFENCIFTNVIKRFLLITIVLVGYSEVQVF